VLTADAIDAHDTFDAPHVVLPAALDDWSLDEGDFTARLPAKSVVVLTLE